MHRRITLRKWKGSLEHNFQLYKTALFVTDFLVVHSSVTFTEYAKNTKLSRRLTLASLEIKPMKTLPTKILFSL